MHIGILQTGHAPESIRERDGDYAALFHELLDGNGFRFSTFSVVDMEFPDAVTDCDGWLITGSRHGAYEDHPFIAPLETFIRDTFDQDIPMVGICFGHQIIAQALGGQVEKFKGGWAVGRQTYEWDGNELALNAWHQDQVVELPETATCLAGNDFCENAALIYGRKAFTVQPHPEFGSPVIKGLIEERRNGPVPAPLLETAEERLSDPVDNTVLAGMIANFFLKRSPTPT